MADRVPRTFAPERPLIGFFDRLARPLLRALDPEDAHSLTIKALKFAPRARPPAGDSRLAVRAFGLNFPNPVGIAPGFDKHAEVPDALLGLGFGFVEIGTVTPLPQPGNPRPRVFRLEPDQAVINRLGFNSEGAAAVLSRLAARAGAGGIVGVNIGANKDSSDRTADYVRLIEQFAPVASYVTVNISSPNTPGLRELQRASALDDLLARVVEARDRVAPRAGPTPVLLKIAPDLSLGDLDDIVGVARARKIDGMIVGNTTIGRPPALRDQATAQAGRRAVGPSALSAVDADAGGDLCAGRRRIPADRRRRHRFRRGRARQDQGRRRPRAALQRAGLSRACAGRRDQGGAVRRARSRRGG